MNKKNVLIIGGGVSGLSAAVESSRLDIDVILIEKAPFIGGHAVQLSCKATLSCVKCGACLVETQMAKVLSEPRIQLFTQSQLTQVAKNEDQSFTVHIHHQKQIIDQKKCNNCGQCLAVCPSRGAVISGTSGYHHPFYAISTDCCQYFKNASCSICETTCPEKAVHLENDEETTEHRVDGVIIATGFKTYEPVKEPYGYLRFPNVITNLMLENMLRRQGHLLRPSDGLSPKRIAFIQCTGSRNIQLDQLWCSQICCGSSLRLASRINHHYPDSEITVYYIDIQNFKKDMSDFSTDHYPFHFVRIIPGDIFETEKKNLQVNYIDPEGGQLKESEFDLVVLAVGMIPSPETRIIADMFNAGEESGFWQGNVSPGNNSGNLLMAGTTCGPMAIPDTIAHSKAIVDRIWRYFNCISMG